MSAVSGAVFLKLGGALLTAKDSRRQPRRAVIRRLAREVAAATAASPRPLVLAHGSGSFAHVAVRETGFLDRPADRLALARVAAAARALDVIVIDALLAAGVPALPVPGSVLAYCRDGRLLDVRSSLVRWLLERRLVPVLYGDAAADETRGGAVASTEALLVALARHVPPERIVLATDVDGVYAGDPRDGEPANALEAITPADWARMAPLTATVRPGVTDVTGGMFGKVEAMIGLVRRQPSVEVLVLSGLRPGAVEDALRGRPTAGGTRIISRADASGGCPDPHTA